MARSQSGFGGYGVPHDPKYGFQWENLSRKAQKGVEREINRIGKNTKNNLPDAIARNQQIAAAKPNTPQGKKAETLANSLSALDPYIKNTPITLKQAAQRRVDVMLRAREAGRAAAARRGDSGRASDYAGYGWYFDHTDQLSADVDKANLSVEQKAHGSAVISPGKDPDKDELPAFKQLVRMHDENHTIKINGQHVPVRDIPSDQLARIISSAASGAPFESSMGSDFSVAGRGHLANTHKAIQVIRKEVEPHEVNDPMTAPKVFAYASNKIAAMTATEMEKLDAKGIAYHSVHGDPNQGMFMFSAPRPGTEYSRFSILTPDGDTAEDSWMMAVSNGQANDVHLPGRGLSSAAKRVLEKNAPGDMSKFSKTNAGVAGDASLAPAGLVHAFNNQATRMASRMLGPVTFNQHGEDVFTPSGMVQPVTWTQFRRDAGGDSEYNNAQKAQAKEDAAAARASKTAAKQQKQASRQLRGMSKY